MSIRLTISGETSAPHLAGRSFSFSGRGVSIGRVEGNDIVLPVEHISSRHAVIRWRGGRFAVSDLESTNGSLVLRGGQRLLLGPKGQAEIALETGDQLVLGDIDNPVTLLVELEPEGPQVGGQTVAVATRSRRDSLALSQRGTGDLGSARAIFRLVEAIGPARDRDAILGRVAEAALDAIPGAADALVAVRRAGGWAVEGEAHRGVGISRQPDPTVCRQVLESEVALLFGAHDDAALAAETLAGRGVGLGIAAPLWGEGEARGVLQINCGPGGDGLREVHLDLAVVLAHHAAVALERAELIARLEAAERRLRDENALLRRTAQPEVEQVAESPAMVRVLEDMRRAARSDVTVLIQGETGTGKEVAARWIHESSHRRQGLLVPVNCGALAESLLDSELFGHRKGAFTGAASDRKGVFEVARGGTVFLDEVGETPPAVQVRLLRVLEEGKVKPVGEAVERPVDVRIIAATNRDLAQLVQQGRFRQDLFYRLRVFPVTLPPLRERPEDIMPLCQLFIRRYARQVGKQVGPLEPTVLQAMRRYPFPGNVRELANEIERAVVRAEPGDPLGPELFSDELFPLAPEGDAASDPRGLRDQLAEVERQLIVQALGRSNGSRSAAARELGITRQGLNKKIERLGIELDRQEER